MPRIGARAEPVPGTPEGNTWKTLVTGGCLALALTGCLTYVIHDHQASARATAADKVPTASANQVVPTPQPPPDITWELVSGVATPVSLTVGPTKADGPVRYGFAHTPPGAVLAAVNIAIRYALTPGNGWLQVTQRQVEPGKSRNAFITERGSLTDLTPPEGGYGQLAGYRLLNYSPTAAHVQLTETFASGVRQSSELTVVWQNNDWLLALEPDGGTGPQRVLDSNAPRFVALSARMFP